MRRMKKYTPTKFKARDSVYDKAKADYAVSFIECLCHTKGTWAGVSFFQSLQVTPNPESTQFDIFVLYLSFGLTTSVCNATIAPVK